MRRTSQSVALAGIEESCAGECLQGAKVADLTLGKPSLFPLSTSATIAQALKALRCNEDVDGLSVWVDNSSSDGDCNSDGLGGTEHLEAAALSKSGSRPRDRYRCGGMVTTFAIITYLAREENLADPLAALHAPLSVLFPSLSQAVEHVHPRSSLCQTLDVMLLDGVQHLVVPIAKRQQKSQRKTVKIPGTLYASATDVPAGDYCSISQEDVVRYLLTSLGAFYPLPMMTLDDLRMINTDIMIVHADAPATSALPLIEQASRETTAVAVVTGCTDCEATDHPHWAGAGAAGQHPNWPSDGNHHRPILAGELSSQTMRWGGAVNETASTTTAAAALASLSVRDFLQYAREAASWSPSPYFMEKILDKLNKKKKEHAKCSSRDPTAGQYCSVLNELMERSGSVTLPSAAASTTTGLSPFRSSASSTDDEGDYYYDTSSDDDQTQTAASNFLGLDVASMTLTKLKLDRPSRLKRNTPAGALITCRPHSTLVAVMAQALALRVNHVWVTDVDGGLVGIVTYMDMISALVSHLHSSKRIFCHRSQTNMS